MASGFKNSIESIFNRMMLLAMGSALFNVLLGIILFCISNITDKAIGIVAGLGFIVKGLSALYNYLKRDGAKLYSLNIVFSVIYLALGVVLVIFPGIVANFIVICLGIYVAVNGISKINYALWLKRGSEQSWLVTLAAGIMLIIIGFLIAFNPFVKLSLSQLVATFMIITGLLDFAYAFLFKLRNEEIREIFW